MSWGCKQNDSEELLVKIMGRFPPPLSTANTPCIFALIVQSHLIRAHSHGLLGLGESDRRAQPRHRRGQRSHRKRHERLKALQTNTQRGAAGAHCVRWKGLHWVLWARRKPTPPLLPSSDSAGGQPPTPIPANLPHHTELVP